MKNSCKKALSVVLTVVILLTAAPMSDFAGLELNIDWLNFDWLDLSTKSYALSSGGSCGSNATYTFDSSTGTLTISGTGSVTEDAFKLCSEIKRLIVNDGITAIGIGAFFKCTGLTEVSLPDTLTSIEGSAFESCTGLIEISIPDSVKTISSFAFENCTALTGVHISDSAEFIGTRAFKDCCNLNEIIIPDSVTDIGEWAFYGCTGLVNVTVGCGIVSYGTAVFKNCSSLEQASFADGSTVLFGFMDCINLSRVIVPESITTIDNVAFSGCTSLTGIEIPEGVASIGESAFKNCSGLTSINIPQSVTAIGESAFSGCTGLTNVDISSLPAWCRISFASDSNPVAYAHTLSLNGSPVTDLTVPDGITEIKDYAFCGAECLKSLTVPGSVTRIGRAAFQNCTGLTSAHLNDGVKSIDVNAFLFCSSLNSVSLPDSLRQIENNAFGYCTGLPTLTVPDTVMQIGDFAFNYVPNIIYNGQAPLPPSNYLHYTAFGARTKNGYVEYPVVYTDSSKSNVTAFISTYEGSFSLPEGIVTIAGYTFFNCPGLTGVEIPEGVQTIETKTFQNCPALKSVTIPLSVTQIISDAFGDLPSNTGFTVFCYKSSYGETFAKNKKINYWLLPPAGEDPVLVRKISNNCKCYIDRQSRVLTVLCNGEMPPFQAESPKWKDHLRYIEHVVVNEGCTKISYDAFNNMLMTDVLLPSSISEIEAYSFADSQSLSSIIIPEGVISIGRNAFYNCSALEEITIPDSLTSIGSNAFAGTAIKNLQIPDTLTSIGYNAFNCGLKNLTLRCSLPADIPFGNCSGIETITLTTGSGVMCDYYGSPWNSSRLTIKSVTFEEGITHIGDYAFNYCQVKVDIPSTVTSIGDYAFSNCTAMDDVSLPASVQRIGMFSFSGVSTIRIYNPNCVIGIKAIPSTAVIYGYEGSTAEKYANEVGCNFIELESNHEHIYDNVCDSTCSICGFVRAADHDFDNDCDDTCNLCGLKRTPKHHYTWVTVANPTTTQEGLAQKKCTVCGLVGYEFTIPCLIADFVTGITLSPKTIALNVGETADIAAVITPDTATNKAVIWSSTYSENVTVDNGTITAILPGTSVIIAETEDGGYRDFCHVRVIGVTPSNGAVIDSESGLIYGLSPNLNSVESFVNPLDETITVTCSDDVIGTGSVIQIVRGGETVDAYKAVIFGDVNSDGIYDGQDALIVNCIANGMLTREQVGEAKYLAADCNHDGEVNSTDVLILEQAGLLLANVDQSQDDYMETDAYAEYLDLIDQNPTADETPETPDEPDAPAQTPVSFLAKIIEIINTVVDFIRSLIVR
ncbi:MAG: leucine-rich repeat protein [Clostridia bacterium]|nr:leucine-rich repeat protein [Clostridia bacterium]